MFKFKKVTVPTTDTQELQAIETWIVSWTKRYGAYFSETKVCYQAFTNEDDANKMKRSLEDAHKLIGNTSGTEVSIEKQKSGL